MKISYGPPPARGVTQLMAVSGDDFDETATDRACARGGVVALAVAGLGFLLGSRTVRDVGIGAAVALYGVRAIGRRKAVEVVQPAPAPASGWRY